MNGVLSPILKHIRLSYVAPHLKGKVLDFGCEKATLLNYVNKNMDYTGTDTCEESLAEAIKKHPEARFLRPAELAALQDKFDTVVSIATIGLVDDQTRFLADMGSHLNDNGKIVLTTPHPFINWLHQLGGKFGLFGTDYNYASARQLPDKDKMKSLAASAGLAVVDTKYFMLGVNQMFILKRAA